jgi:hypothetical protein
MRIVLYVLAAALAALLPATALGMIIDSAGNITDWGLRPFSQPNQQDRHQGNLWSTLENNYSPISYPWGIGHQPSPGLGSGGEAWDLEELHLRFTDTQLQFLVVTSSAPSSIGNGLPCYLGDLFLDYGGSRVGIVTQSASQGLSAGAVYRINGSSDTKPLQQAANSYYGRTEIVDNDYGPDATVAEVAGPWAVDGTIDPSLFLGSAAIQMSTFDYGGAENGTFLLEYTLDRSLIGPLDPNQLTAKMAWGCGNDVIRVRGETPTVPEPATLVLLAAGLALVRLARRRRRMA